MSDYDYSYGRMIATEMIQAERAKDAVKLRRLEDFHGSLFHALLGAIDAARDHATSEARRDASVREASYTWEDAETFEFKAESRDDKVHVTWTRKSDGASTTTVYDSWAEALVAQPPIVQDMSEWLPQ